MQEDGDIALDFEKHGNVASLVVSPTIAISRW